MYCDIGTEAERQRAQEAADEQWRAEADRRQRLDEAMGALGPAACRELAMARPHVPRNIKPTPSYIRALVADALDELGWDLDAARQMAREAS